jgi:2-polyprenyl-6-hydroxyphenyl methylase / 3-demethylubiquinone-9 3-methyltransferase
MDQNLLNKKLDVLLENTGDMALKRRAKKILLAIDPQKNENILDIGCGDGYYLHLMSNLGIPLQLTGTDYDEVGLTKARKNLGKKIPLYQGDLMKKLPFKNAQFDKATMSEVAEHLPDDVKGLKEVYRILKKGGTLVLTVPCHNYPFFWDPINWILEHLLNTHIKSGFFAGLWNQHERLYTPDEIKKVVEKAGFTVEQLETTTWWCLPFNHYIVNLTARLLAHGNISEDTRSSLSKFTKEVKRPWYLNVAFGFVNELDKLNDMYHPKDRGVGVFIKAIK